jgi:hypothetical protein
LNGFLLLENSSDELLEADSNKLVLVILMPMHLLAGLVVTLQTEEGVLLTSLVEADHPRLLLIDALGEVLDFGDILSRALVNLLFFHVQTKIII